MAAKKCDLCGKAIKSSDSRVMLFINGKTNTVHRECGDRYKKSAPPQ